VRLLVTRPEPDAERTATALRARGHDVVAAPILRIETLADAELGSGPWAAILASSANAASALARHQRLAELRALPAFAVGDRSAAAMRAAGFADVTSADGDAGDLAALVARRLRSGTPLLYVAGADRYGGLEASLASRGFMVRTAVVYRAIAAATLPPAAADALARGIDGVLHFSRRSAEAYVHATRRSGLDDNALKNPVHFCLSAQVAEPLAQTGAADIRVAPAPAEAALIALIPPP
jgi:uroporphyrinogen-III synthase